MAAPGAYEPQSAPISAGDHEECGWKRGGGLESGTDVTKATWWRLKCGGLDGAGLLMEEMSGCLFPLSSGPTGVNPLEDERSSPRGSARSRCIDPCLRGADPLLLSKRELRMGQALAVAFLLIRLDLGQHRAEALVGDDGTL